MTRRVRLFVLGLALCTIAVPARADLFDFTFSKLSNSFDGSTFTAVSSLHSDGSVDRNITPVQSTHFAGALGANFFSLSMPITNITATTADGFGGTFTITDRDGDTITGNVNGHWTTAYGDPTFAGTLSNVMFNQVVNATFNGDAVLDAIYGGGPVSMVFSAPPWNGTLTELTTSGAWFQNNTYSGLCGGSVDAGVVPVPAAFLLGLLGMGAAGLKLRKFA